MIPAKQTDHKSDTEKSETVQNSIVNKWFFSSTKFCSGIQNQTKRTSIEMKFYTHLRKYASKVSTNFELNRTCESTADLKLQPEIGVLLGFSRTNSN
jgi:hypothetical protein